MKLIKKCYCIRCDKELKNLAYYFEDKGFQPSDGLCFRTYGHYGSCEFDPMNGEYREVTLCDECFSKLEKSKYMYKGKK